MYFRYTLLAVLSCIIYIGRTTYSDFLGVHFLDTKTTWNSQVLKTLKFSKINVQKNVLEIYSFCT